MSEVYIYIRGEYWTGNPSPATLLACLHTSSLAYLRGMRQLFVRGEGTRTTFLICETTKIGSGLGGWRGRVMVWL